MQDNRIHPLDNQRADEITQSGMLNFVLREHPDQLSRSEILSEIGDDDGGRRAITDLVKAGLLRQEGDSILPTRPALHYYRLEQG